MAFSLSLTLTAAFAGYAVYAQRRHRQTVASLARTNQALAVLDDELTATNRVLDDRAADTRKIVAAIKGLDARTQMHAVWLQGLAAHTRLNVYRPAETPESEWPIKAADVIAAAEGLFGGER